MASIPGLGSASSTTGTPQVRVRRNGERGFEDFGWTDNWMTFSFGGYHSREWNNFGPLRVIVENHIQPYSGFPSHSHRDAEIVTYVVAGCLTHKDSFGHTAGVTAGEMQLISAGSHGMIHSEQNVHGEVEHNLQIWLIPSEHPTPFAYHQLKYTPEQRQGQFRRYVAPASLSAEELGESMPIHTGASIYAGLFRAGDEVRHVLENGVKSGKQGAWVQVVDGQVNVAGVDLSKGDGAGITGAEALDFRFGADTEVLFFDLDMGVRLLWR